MGNGTEKERFGGAATGTALALAVAVFLVTLILFWPVGGNEFVRIDDTVYVTDNPVVLRGLTFPGLRWALTTFHGSNWHPLTWLSHMLDIELFGTAAGGHHLTSVVIHALNAALLFAALLRMSGRPWTSTAVALLFALHPLHVESVAWAAERKDVLSTLFGMVALLAYVRYTARPSPGRYLIVAAAMGLGLLAKPMIVTLPFVLLLLDYWPLGRLQPMRRDGLSPPRTLPAAAIVAEKIPLLLLSAASSIVTVLAQRHEGIRTLDETTLGVRAGNAVVSYVRYLWLTFRPTRLIFFYEYPSSGWSTGEVVGAGTVLLVLSALVLLKVRRHPYLLTGWLWYLGTLVPVIGIVQVGGQAIADRYTYFPLIGIFLAGVWLIAAFVPRGRAWRITAAVSGGLLIGLLAVLTRVQLGYWHDEATLQQHVLSVEPDNYLALENLGAALVRQGKTREGQEYLARAYERNPALLADAHLIMGRNLLREGKREEALQHLRKAVEMNPRSEDARTTLRSVQQGRAEQIRAQFQELLAAGRVDAAAYHRQGLLLAWEGLYEEALEPLFKAISLQPGLADAYNDIGVTYTNLGREREAAAYFEKELQIRSGQREARQPPAEPRATPGR